uniref:Integrase core domain containing protein n=1 Tax=Solanum tuberosum TaxID=4113 RepID=M1DUM0_SOLTU
MGKEPGSYREEIVREFYASNAATLRGSIHRNANPRAQTTLKVTLVRGFSVDISEVTIHRFLYCPGRTWELNTGKFDYRWDFMWGGEFQQSAEKREIVLHWLARYIATDVERVEWIVSLRGDIDAIISTPIDELESAPNVLADDIVLGALFSEDIVQPEPIRAHGKRPHSKNISDTTKEAREKKWERQQYEQTRKVSIVDEELRQQRARESSLGASSSWTNTEVVDVV